MNRILSLLRWPPNTQLGPLEQQLLSALWMRGSATVRELLDAGEIKLAESRVMTVLDRLYKKQLLNRPAEGRAFRYSPRYTREELAKAVVRKPIRQLLPPGAAAPL